MIDVEVDRVRGGRGVRVDYIFVLHWVKKDIIDFLREMLLPVVKNVCKSCEV